MLKEAEQAKSPDEYKNAWTTDEEYQYDPMKSTSSRDVYFKRDKLHQIDHVQKYDYETKKWISYHDRTFYKYSDDEHNVEYYKNKEEKNNGWVVGRYEIIKTIQGYRYIAFSKDKSSFIMWFEEDDNLDGVILEKREYKRVPKEELLPKAVNYDFLNR